MTQAHTNALQTIIGEFKNISPEITNVFMFKPNGEIVASDGVTVEEQCKNLISVFNGISFKAETIGNIENVTIRGTDRHLSITCMNNRYLATVFSREANEKTVKSLTHVFVPTVVGLVDEISESGLPKISKPEIKQVEEILPIPESPPAEPIAIPEEPPMFSSDPPLPVPPVTQFMVEKIGGLLVSADTVRVNSDVIAKWDNLYGDKQITEVHIETLEGKSTTCKFKSVKEASNNARGIIQIPEKILQILQTSKGKLVIVKPVVT